MCVCAHKFGISLIAPLFPSSTSSVCSISTRLPPWTRSLRAKYVAQHIGGLGYLDIVIAQKARKLLTACGNNTTGEARAWLVLFLPRCASMMQRECSPP
ncbi:hypothetical protein BC830DRAFT_1135444 [Chytriomyces sp. MP71]|nr:hypothetical protein BC830DRAFT_1135444 [Chytriomyces sp. MP71]